MAVCTFWGHERIFDVNLYERLKAVLGELLHSSESLDFWFTDTGGDWLYELSFMNLCFTAAWEIRQHSEGKRVTITWVISASERKNWERRLSDSAVSGPPCLIDRVLVAPVRGERSKAALMEWMCRRSDHLVSYIYDDIFDGERGALEAATRQGKRVHSLTFEGTQEEILQDAEALMAQERYIFKKVRSGKSLEEIGSTLNLGISEMRGRIQATRRTLQGQASARLRSQRRNLGEPEGRTCSILTLGDPTSEALSAFTQRLTFLMSRYNIAQVYILAEYCQSPYMAALRRAPMQRRGRYVAVTHLSRHDELSSAEWASMCARYCQPCSAVENIDTHTEDPRGQILTALRVLIERSDFCICDLSNGPFADEICCFAASPKAAKLLDVGKTSLPPVMRGG